VRFITPSTYSRHKSLALAGVLICIVSAAYPSWLNNHAIAAQTALDLNKIKFDYLKDETSRLNALLEDDVKAIAKLGELVKSKTVSIKDTDEARRELQKRQRDVLQAEEKIRIVRTALEKIAAEQVAQSALMVYYRDMFALAMKVGAFGLLLGFGAAISGFWLWYSASQPRAAA
jgi:hypothetical protein